MRIGVLQATGDPERPARNLAVLRSAAGDASARGCGVLVTPELFLPGYAPRLVAGRDGDEQRTAAAGLAAEFGLHLVVSTVEHDGSKRYISAHLFAPNGSRVLRYRKTHLFGEENEVFDAGDAPSAVARIEGMAVALGICFDVEFPEYVRVLADAGAELLLVPTAVPRLTAAEAELYEADFVVQRIVPARAMESTVALAYANQARPGFIGSSRIIGPAGDVRASAGRGGPELVVAEVDGVEVGRARAVLPYLSARRPRIYRAPEPESSQGELPGSRVGVPRTGASSGAARLRPGEM
ncbi:nitrilase-related carbon-nitrogen hydrolase [Sciscionella sediminilitoris]|uniref:nitrilase-related carbon-nitrogen hydrolase n=1 Tax=Sciscionella sediminilitoris TaxID=1445613 RepID=UPI0018D063E1|nr:nitrilase-related carbon-nitrogen hydrolase [Sciscionella sp. SE31]